MSISTSMTSRFAGIAALAVAAGALASFPVLGAETEIGAVTIRAKRAIETEVGRTSSGVPVVMYELGYHVSYRDLDLSTAGGADALKQRVREAAAEACADLDKMYPLTEPDKGCANRAGDEAMEQAKAAIEAARK